MNRPEAPHLLDRAALCFITMTVPDLQLAERFYVDELGFSVSRRFEPTRWLSLSVDEKNGPGLGLMEDRFVPPGTDRVDFWVKDLHAIFAALSSNVEVIHSPRETPWGSFKAEIKDCFGRCLGLVQHP